MFTKQSEGKLGSTCCESVGTAGEEGEARFNDLPDDLPPPPPPKHSLFLFLFPAPVPCVIIIQYGRGYKWLQITRRASPFVHSTGTGTELWAVGTHSLSQLYFDNSRFFSCHRNIYFFVTKKKSFMVFASFMTLLWRNKKEEARAVAPRPNTAGNRCLPS